DLVHFRKASWWILGFLSRAKWNARSIADGERQFHAVPIQGARTAATASVRFILAIGYSAAITASTTAPRGHIHSHGVPTPTASARPDSDSNARMMIGASDAPSRVPGT